MVALGRVMSYNILADLYADSDFSREQLFPQCPPFALGIHLPTPTFSLLVFIYLKGLAHEN